MSLIMTQSYRDELLQADPSHMVVMLYDELLATLNTTIEAIEADDQESRCNAVNLACELVGLLHLGLDMERGEEIAENLGHLYVVILRHLPRINLENSRRIAEQVIQLVTPLRESWAELDRRGAEASVPGGMPALARERAGAQGDVKSAA